MVSLAAKHRLISDKGSGVLFYVANIAIAKRRCKTRSTTSWLLYLAT
jgi:hypothetical protein